jgi:hypothetical protein
MQNPVELQAPVAHWAANSHGWPEDLPKHLVGARVATDDKVLHVPEQHLMFGPLGTHNSALLVQQAQLIGLRTWVLLQTAKHCP